MRYWNYNWAASYFITICTHHRQHFFGKIQNQEMITNAVGAMVNLEWLKTLELRPDMNLLLDDYQVMPNHFHGIVVIGPNEFNAPKTGNGDVKFNDNRTGTMPRDIEIKDGRTEAMHRVSTIKRFPKHSCKPAGYHNHGFNN